MAIPVNIASLHFPSRTKAKAYFRAIRDRYKDGQHLNELDSRHLTDLIAIHPEVDVKLRSGVSHYTVETDSKFGTTRHFTIHRKDGSKTDVSFRTPIDGRNPKRDRFDALRRGIEDQILNFRSRAFQSNLTPQCPLRGVPVTPDSYHIDHTPPRTLVWLVDQWLEQLGISIEDIQITPPADNQIVTEMTDNHQLSSWSNFHREHARLRLLSPTANLSDAKLK